MEKHGILRKHPNIAILAFLVIVLSSYKLVISYLPSVEASVIMAPLTDKDYNGIRSNVEPLGLKKEDFKKITVLVKVKNLKSANNKRIVIDELGPLFDKKLHVVESGSRYTSNDDSAPFIDAEQYIIFDGRSQTEEMISETLTNAKISVFWVTDKGSVVTKSFTMSQLLRIKK